MTVRAEVGDWVLIRNRRLHQPSRTGQIVGVPHADGSPPYVVHWLDDERTSLVFPGTDAVIAGDPPVLVAGTARG